MKFLYLESSILDKSIYIVILKIISFIISKWEMIADRIFFKLNASVTGDLVAPHENYFHKLFIKYRLVFHLSLIWKNTTEIVHGGCFNVIKVISVWVSINNI